MKKKPTISALRQRIEDAERQIKMIENRQRFLLIPVNFLDTVCDVFNVKRKAVESKSRKRELVEARMTFTTLLYRKYIESQSAVATLINRNHSTGNYYVKTIDFILKSDATFKEKYYICSEKLDEMIKENEI